MRFAAASPLLLAAVVAGCPVPDCSDDPGTACTWAGVEGQRGWNEDGLDRRESWLGFVSDLTFDPQGRAVLVDWNNHLIRRVEPDDTISTILGTDYEGDGPPGEGDRLPAGNPVGAAPRVVALNHPTVVEFASDGTLVLAAWHNNKIRVMDPDTGVVTVLAGDGYGYTGDGGPAWAAVFNQPKSVVLDDLDRIYLNDQRNQRIRLIDIDADRTITTIAGVGTKGFSGDGGPALEAQFAFDGGTTPLPSGSLALRDGQLFVADSLNHRIRRIDLASGTIDTVAGTGEQGGGGDGGDPLDASLDQPLDIEFGPDGRLYVADTFNNMVRAIDFEAGVIDHVAGTGEPCVGDELFNCFEDGHNVPAEDVRLNAPYGIAFDGTGALYIADTNNSRIVRVAP